MDEITFKSYVNKLDNEVSNILTPPENFNKVYNNYLENLILDIDEFLKKQEEIKISDTKKLLILMELNVRRIFISRIINEYFERDTFFKISDDEISVNNLDNKLDEMNQLLYPFNKKEENFYTVFLKEADSCYLFQ